MPTLGRQMVKMTSAMEGIIGPDAAGVVHDVVQSAQACDHAAHAGGGVFVAGDIDARCVGGGGAFAHGPELQALAGVGQEIGDRQGDGNGQVGQETVGQENFPKPAQLVRKGQTGGEIAAGGGKGNGGDLAAGELDEGAAEEVAEAHAEGGQGQTGDVLVGPEGHSQEAVQKAHQEGPQQGAEQGNDNGRESGNGGSVLLIEEGADDAADAAHIHDTRNAQIQVAGFFREGLAGGAVEQGNALDHGPGDEGNEIKHGFRPPWCACGTSARR